MDCIALGNNLWLINSAYAEGLFGNEGVWGDSDSLFLMGVDVVCPLPKGTTADDIYYEMDQSGCTDCVQLAANLA